jgi:hypothetical protein
MRWWGCGGCGGASAPASVLAQCCDSALLTIFTMVLPNLQDCPQPASVFGFRCFDGLGSALPHSLSLLAPGVMCAGSVEQVDSQFARVDFRGLMPSVVPSHRMVPALWRLVAVWFADWSQSGSSSRYSVSLGDCCGALCSSPSWWDLCVLLPPLGSGQLAMPSALATQL